MSESRSELTGRILSHMIMTPKPKVHYFDDAHNFRVDHFSIRGHLDYLSGTSSVSLGSELIHSDIRVFRPTGPFHSDVRVFHSEDNLSLG